MHPLNPGAVRTTSPTMTSLATWAKPSNEGSMKEASSSFGGGARKKKKNNTTHQVVLSNMFYFHPYPLGKIDSILTFAYFSNGLV